MLFMKCPASHCHLMLNTMDMILEGYLPRGSAGACVTICARNWLKVMNEKKFVKFEYLFGPEYNSLKVGSVAAFPSIRRFVPLSGRHGWVGSEMRSVRSFDKLAGGGGPGPR